MRKSDTKRDVRFPLELTLIPHPDAPASVLRTPHMEHRTVSNWHVDQRSISDAEMLPRLFTCSIGRAGRSVLRL